MSSAYFVATRFLTAKVWENPAKLAADYIEALGNFRNSYHPGLNPYALRNRLIPVINAGRPLADWVIQTRSIPSGKAKGIELAARLMQMSRAPKDIPAWYEKNSERLSLLQEATRWEDRASGEAGENLEVVQVGPFKVHNTIGANAKQLNEIKGLVESAARSLGTTFDFKKVLYGDVFVVGQLKQSETLAWYAVKADDVYLRSLAKKGRDDLQSLIHELGHRYWYKFTTADLKQRVHKLYYDLSNTRPNMPPLAVGDTLPVKVRGTKGPITITGHEGQFYNLSTGGMVKMYDVQKWLRTKAVFPSLYSATDPDEFFAECFAFYTMGTLKPDLAVQFEAAIKGLDTLPNEEVFRV